MAAYRDNVVYLYENIARKLAVPIIFEHILDKSTCTLDEISSIFCLNCYKFVKTKIVRFRVGFVSKCEASTLTAQC